MSEDFINGDIVKQKSDVLERYGKVVEPQSVFRNHMLVDFGKSDVKEVSRLKESGISCENFRRLDYDFTDNAHCIGNFKYCKCCYCKRKDAEIYMVCNGFMLARNEYI